MAEYVEQKNKESKKVRLPRQLLMFHGMGFVGGMFCMGAIWSFTNTRWIIGIILCILSYSCFPQKSVQIVEIADKKKSMKDIMEEVRKR